MTKSIRDSSNFASQASLNLSADSKNLNGTPLLMENHSNIEHTLEKKGKHNCLFELPQEY